MIYILNDSSYNYILKYGDFVAGESGSTWWRLEVVDDNLDAKVIVVFEDRAGNAKALKFEYQGKYNVIKPDSLDFQSINTGKILYNEFSIVNESKIDTIIIQNIFLKQRDGLNTKNGFELLSSDSVHKIKFPLIIKPTENYQFILKFDASEIGIFHDTIMIDENNCIYERCKVRGLTGFAKIEVSDVEFSFKTYYQLIQSNIKIKNKGNIDLYVNSIKGPSVKDHNGRRIFRIYGLDTSTISIANPLVIAPFDSVLLNVDFAKEVNQGDYKDSVIIISNAYKGIQGNDEIAYLSGTITSKPYIKYDYDFGKRRIHRKYFPVKSDYSGSVSGAIIANKWNGPLIIEDVKRFFNGKYYDKIESEFFLDEYIPKDSILYPNDSLIIRSFFQPLNPGYYNARLVIKFKNQTIADSINLNGTGIVPKVKIVNYNFGETVIDSLSLARKVKIKVKNLSNPEWEFYDTLKIFDFRENNISTDISNWSDGLPFRYNKSKIKFPIILAPGDIYEFDAEFVARQAGETKGYLTILSDALNDTIISEWVGYDSGYVDVKENIVLNYFSIYPNPASDFIEIKSQLSPKEIEGVKIYNHLGQSVGVGVHNNEPLRLDVSHLPNGIYFLRIEDELYKVVVWR